MIENHSIDSLRTQASELAAEATKISRIFSTEKEKSIPKFDPAEIKYGAELGRGQFCCVYELKKVALMEGENGTKCEGGDNRNSIATNCTDQSKKHAKYAVKTMIRNLNSATAFVCGVMDLAIETRILAVMNHPNIIKIRGVSTIDPFQDNYFILLDRLYDTLSQRVIVWKEKKKKMEGINKVRDMNGEKKNNLWMQRLSVALDIISAVQYLHDNNIIYRDLKSDNLGFDMEDNVKLFDFGLAKELNPDDQLEGGVYDLPGNTGSLRYMAPEVAKEEAYNLSADVYSFGILLWQICSLKKPFPHYNIVRHSHLVVHGGERPEIATSWSEDLSRIMSTAWSTNMSERPTCCEIIKVLQSEIK